MIHNPQSIKSTWSGVFSLTSPLASPWRSWTFCCRCMWSALSSPSPPSSSLSQSWRSCAGSSICSGPAAKVSPGHLVPHFLTSHLRSTDKNRLVFSDWLCCMANWTAERSEVEKERERHTKKERATFEGVLFVCFRLLPAHLPCVLGTVWPKCCFKTPLFCHDTVRPLTDTHYPHMYVVNLVLMLWCY